MDLRTKTDLADFDSLVHVLPQSHVFISHVDKECRFTRYYGKILTCNRGEQLFRAGDPISVDVIGKRGDEIHDCEGQRQLTTIRKRVIQTGIPEDFEIQVPKSSPLQSSHVNTGMCAYLYIELALVAGEEGEFAFYQACVVPRKDAQTGEISGATTILTDITQRKMAEVKVNELNTVLANQLKQMQAAKDKAENAEKAVTYFLANMSHELRTPLNTILATVELLATSKPAPTTEQVELINLIDRHGHDLLRLLNGILDFSKLEAGKMGINNVAFDLHQLLYDIRDLLNPSMSANRNTLCMFLDPQLPRVVEGDPQALHRIMLNLLSNACKFTNDGHVSIRACVESSDTSPDPSPPQADCTVKGDPPKLFVCEVADTGIGIDEKDISRLFERFSQLDNSNKREYGGTGLGLAICKGLVEKMKGCISMRSQKGKGTTLVFKIPIKEATLPTATPPATGPVLGSGEAVKAELRFQTHNSDDALPRLSPEAKLAFNPESPPQFSDCSVLLVDDNDINRKVIVKMLTRLSCCPRTANNGKEAITTYTDNAAKIDLILMDLHMPDMDGFEATQAIRAWETEHHKPPVYIAALTADVLSGTAERCVKAGMQGFLPKPVSMAEIARVISTAQKSKKPACS